MTNFKSQRARFETLRSRDSATFTGSYQTLGSALSYPARIVKIQNETTVDITISTNGIDDHDIIFNGDRLVYDVTTNNNNTEGLFFPAGTQFYVKGAAGTGSIYLTIIYAQDH